MLLYADEQGVNALPVGQPTAIGEGHRAFRAAATNAGVFVADEALSDAADTVSVGSADGLITDGPFVGPLGSRNKEQIGDYYVISFDSRDDALTWAQRVPAAPGQVVEVRPIVDV